MDQINENPELEYAQGHFSINLQEAEQFNLKSQFQYNEKDIEIHDCSELYEQSIASDINHFNNYTFENEKRQPGTMTMNIYGSFKSKNNSIVMS